MNPTGMGMMFKALGLDMGVVQDQARQLVEGVKEFKTSLDAARADIAAMNERLARLEAYLMADKEAAPALSRAITFPPGMEVARNVSRETIRPIREPYPDPAKMTDQELRESADAIEAWREAP